MKSKAGWKLTDDQKQAIVAAYLRGETISVLARQYSVWPKSIWEILTRRGVPIRPRGQTVRVSPPADMVAVLIPQLTAAELQTVRRTATEILREIGVE